MSWSQKQQFKQMLLQRTPQDYGIDRNLWTAKIMIQVIEKNWNIQLKDSRIYEIIGELNLSYQKSHRDYANADKVKQKQFVELLKKTEKIKTKKKKLSFSTNLQCMTVLVFFMDGLRKTLVLRFPVTKRKKRQKVNGLLSVDAISGEEYLQLKSKAKSEDIASYFGFTV